MIQCKTCKKKISEKAKVCPNCGEKTLYGINNQREVIIIIIVLVIIIGLAFLITLFISKADSIKGSWKITNNYKKDESTRYKQDIIEGKEITIYKFSKKNKCKKTIIIDAQENIKPIEVDGIVRGMVKSEPYNHEVDYNCTYKIKNKKIIIKYEEIYNEKFYIRLDKDNLYLDGDKYIKMD